MIAFKKVKKEQFVSDGGLESVFEEISLPKRATAGSAGYDIFAPCDVVVKKGETALIATGIKAEMPQNVVLLILPRSGLGFKYKLRLCNTVGVIDAEYRGEIMVALHNHSDAEQTVDSGERIAQLVVMPVCLPTIQEVDELEKTDRGAGGFGSTGAV